MLDIKIFVSHRIDIDSELIDNPVYVPMRCGAVFDKENPMHIAGDDTGDNISEQRMSFCEFTVQYWAWKNTEADYYGLCHYRRYLSFSNHKYRTDEFNMVFEPFLTPWSKKKYGLLDSEAMRKLISKYDIVTSEPAYVPDIPTPVGHCRIVRELWEAHDGIFLEKSSVDLLFDLIDKMAPVYSQSAREYFRGEYHRGFNCYVLRRELFVRLCEFQFPIMFEVERMLDTADYTQTMHRTPAFIGEMIYGIFLHHVITYEQWRVKELQLVFFRNTDKIENRRELIRRSALFWLDRGLRAIADPIIPKGSCRRERVKDIFYSITGAKRRGAADIK